MPSGRREVHLTAEAEADLEEILEYIEVRDSSERADCVFEQIKSTILALDSAPKRGRVVPELREVGVTEYREVAWKPYRIIYFAVERRVYVVAVFDGRRDVDQLLVRRLLR